MKKIFFSLLFVLLSLTCFSQKPMVGYTIEDIKDYNRIQFGTLSWEYDLTEEFFTMKTFHPEIEVVTVYYFPLKGLKNIMCAHGTKNNATGAMIALEIVKTMVRVSDKKFYDPATRLYVEYELLNNNIHSFIYSYTK